MIPLLLLILLASIGHSRFALDPDCVANACFILIKCDGLDEVITYMPAKPCKDGLKMVAEIDIRSPYRFDFRVFIGENLNVELVLPNLVTLNHGRGTAHLFGGRKILLNNTHYEDHSQGDVTANMSNYRFTYELKYKDYNLITELGRYRALKYKLPGSEQAYFDKRHIFTSFQERASRMWCNYYEIVDTCETLGNGQCSMLNLTDPATACDSRLWFHNSTSDKWLWMTKLQCKDGLWSVSASDRAVPIIKELDLDSRTKLYCAPALPRCEHRIRTIQLVVIILLGMYCGFVTMGLVLLFVILYHKMDAMKGRSTYGIMTRMPAPPSSGSSSENESGSGKKTTEDKGVMMKVKKEKKKKPAKKAKKASKTKKEQKSGSASSAEGRSD